MAFCFGARCIGRRWWSCHQWRSHTVEHISESKRRELQRGKKRKSKSNTNWQSLRAKVLIRTVKNRKLRISEDDLRLCKVRQALMMEGQSPMVTPRCGALKRIQDLVMMYTIDDVEDSINIKKIFVTRKIRYISFIESWWHHGYVSWNNGCVTSERNPHERAQ